jgi:uncharacterized protein YutE (UPF0331/DUF86 family)
MKEQIYELETIVKLRKTVSHSYTTVNDQKKYVSCVNIIYALEEQYYLE